MFVFFNGFLIILTIVLGFVILHFAKKEGSKHLNVAGYVALIGGVLLSISLIFTHFSGCRTSSCPYKKYGERSYHKSHGFKKKMYRDGGRKFERKMKGRNSNE